MTLQQLRDFVAVVLHGGYRSAARDLHRSQAMLTKSVAKLEQDHGVILLDRSGTGTNLTTDGQEFLRYAQSILAEADRAQDWLQTPRQRRAASVSLGVSIEPSLILVPSVVEDFRKTLSYVTVRMAHGVSSELIAGVRENRFELAIMRLPFERHTFADLHAEVLYQAEPAIVARAGHPLQASTSHSALTACDWVVVGDPSQPGTNDASIRELFDEHSRTRPRIAAVTDSLLGAVATLVGSDCVARLPRTALEHPLIRGKLVALPMPDPPKAYQVGLVRKPTRPLTREAQALAAMIASFARISRGLGRPSSQKPSAPLAR